MMVMRVAMSVAMGMAMGVIVPVVVRVRVRVLLRPTGGTGAHRRAVGRAAPRDARHGAHVVLHAGRLRAARWRVQAPAG